MVDITIELVKKVAKNARLPLTNEEIEKLIPEITDVLGLFSQLDNVDTTGVTPSFQPITIKNVMRDDTITPCLSQEAALKNTKHKINGYFKGPRAI